MHVRMLGRTVLLFSLIFYTLSGFTECSIISQSSVTLCENAASEPSSPEGTTCSKKMLVTMGLKAGQSGSESLYANIDRVYQEGQEQLSRLKNPYRIEIRKSAVTVTYPLYYRGSANAHPREEYILQRSCSDDWYLESSQLSCGKFHDGTEYVFDSQGFCCRCSALSILRFNEGIDNIRANHSCHLFGGVYASAHCLRFSDLWYDIYDIGPPYLWYNITIDILEFGGVEEGIQGGSTVLDVRWNPVATVVISPEALLRRSEDGKVIAEIQGELVGGHFIRDFSTKYLGVPNILHLPADNMLPVQYTNGASDWLVVDKHQVDLSGKTCNKIGTSFTAFRYQDKPCTQEQFSCLRDQPIHYWKTDDDLRQEDKPGHYMLYNFGDIHPSTMANNHSVTLRFRHNDFQNTMVTFQIDASDITYVYSIASGRIVNAYANNFDALKDNGFIYVEIENTGEVTAEFSVSVTHCTHGVMAVSGRSIDLNPGEAREFTFQIRTYKALGSDYSCEVQLFDADYNLIQSAQVSFATNGTCFCYGICGCVCNPLEELVCPEPPTLVVSGDLAKRILFIILKSLGAHGVALILGGMLLILGCIKLSFGKLIFCRKTKAEAMAEELKKRGLVNQQGPMLVMCGGKCTGARAAKARYERQAQRRKKLGKKKPLDKNWRNSSYACTCNTELTDVRFVAILRSLFFFFFCCFLPFVALGKKVVGSFQATEKVKRKAERKVVRKAVRRGKAHKYLVGEQLGNVQDDLVNNGWEDDEGSSEEESNWLLQATEEMTVEGGVRKEVARADASMKEEKVNKSKCKMTAKTQTRTMQ